MAGPAKAPAMLAGAHSILGSVMGLMGQWGMAREHLESAIELFGPGPFRNFGDAIYAQTATLLFIPLMLCLGYPVAALGKTQEILAAARRRSDPYYIAAALSVYAINHLLLGDSRNAIERAEEMFSIATEHGLTMYLTVGTFFRGWATADAGRGKAGIAEMRQALSDLKAKGTTAIAMMLVVMADVCVRNGLAEEGLAAVAEGLALAEHTDCEAEFHRLEGELMMIKYPGNQAQAEDCFRTGIAIARRQSAKFWELRATMSFARLLAKQGRRDEARARLAEIYGWFTEGFDIADLKDARRLLDDLSA
jgi:predicted ATPase